MSGILYQDPPRGVLSEPTAEELAAASRPALMNPMIARQGELYRATHPRAADPMQQGLDLGAGLLGIVPGVGDALGLAADINAFRNHPELRTPLNFGLSGLGLVPLIPALSTMKNVSKADYLGSHRPPSPDYGAPLHDLTQGDLIPQDIYSPQAVRYYGTGDARMDADTVRMFRAMRGKPDEMVSIYRAVPKDAPDSINAGDWVTINKDYAKIHGEGPLGGNYKIVEQKVRAKDLWTSLDSIHEFGYHPQK